MLEILKIKPITEDTIKAMRNRHPEIIKFARQIIYYYNADNPYERAKAIIDFVNRNITYTRDPYKTELVLSPFKILEFKAGDCDDQTVLTCALLKALGFKCGFRTIATKNFKTFNHVYGYVEIDGKKVPFDTTKSNKLGWEYKFYFKKKDWGV